MKIHTLPSGRVINLERIQVLERRFNDVWITFDEKQFGSSESFTSEEAANGFIAGLIDLANGKVDNSIPLPEVAIVILDKGFVYAGFVHFSECGGYLTIRNGVCVRRWSVESGLGQVASNGPDKDVILNECPDIFVPVRSLIHMLAINRAKWERFR